VSQESIDLINEKITFVLKGKQRIKKWIAGAIQKEKCKVGALCYVFCNDKYLLALNKKYLKHDYFTDIITFDNTEPTKGKNKVVSGDIFISIDRVKDNARNLGTTFDNELKRVMIHGVLHLVGYSDKGLVRKKEMRKKEDLYIKHYNKY
jgi:probable rRNA maturation factor